ncbi:MAG: choice-of-anchor B family protein [Bacteroidota bacterium]
MKKNVFIQSVLTFMLFLIAFSTTYCQLNINLLSHIDYQNLHDANLNDVWGYMDELGNEYAIVGTSKGTSIVNVTNPSNPVEVFWLPGSESIWRDPCVYGDYAFVTTEAEDGLTIIDMSPLPQSNALTHTIYTGPTSAYWESAHTCFVDENGYAYIFGANRGNGGTIILDVQSNPMNPTEVGTFDSWYIHDGFVRNDTLYAAHIYDGFFSLVDVSDKSNPILLGTKTTPNTFTHNIWPSENGQFVYTTDEVSGAFIGVYDISDPTNIIEVDRTRHSPTFGVIPHNTHVKENYLITSYYSDGVLIHDITHPTNTIKVGQFDTYPLQTPDFSGCWGVYPFLPSGIILASDITEGLFILGPNYQKACYLEGIVTDQSTGLPLSNVSVQIVTNDQKEQTNSLGIYETGIFQSGQYSVTFQKVGYYPQTESVALSQGISTSLNIALTPIPPFPLNIDVYDAQTGAPISNANIKLYHPFITHEGITNGLGQEAFTLYYPYQYRVAVGKWGYKGVCNYVNIDQTTNSLVFNLEQGFYDDFEFDFGWTVSGNAETGIWVREKPLITANTVLGIDADYDCGDMAYVTGNFDNTFSPDLDDVDNGFTQLLSPQFHVNGMSTPHINYALAYYCFYGPGEVDDTLNIFLSNGIDQVQIDQIIPPQQFMSWTYRSIPIPAGFTLNNTLQLKIVASDYVPNVNVTEAMFDWFYVTDYDATGVVDLVQQLSFYPNPVEELLTVENLDLDFPIEITNAMGQKVFQGQLKQSLEQINCAQFMPGIYMLKNGINTFKFLKL